MDKYYKAIQSFKDFGGFMRTAQAIKIGIAPKTLYSMLKDGVITRVSRGLYKLSQISLLDNSDLVTIAIKYPDAVICLISALNYYDLTDQISHYVYIAFPRGVRRPLIDYPPLKITWLSDHIYKAGIQVVGIENISIKIYSPEKTITDCFKYRNKYGLDVAIDALKRYMSLPPVKQKFYDLVHFARLNRVENIIMPYIESLQ